MLIENLKKVATRNNEVDIIEKIDIIENSDNFKIAVMGRFSSGKSTLINNLLNKKDLLYSDLSEATAKITLISYSEKEFFTVVFKDKAPKKTFSLDKLNNFHLNNKELLQNIDYFKVYINNPNLKGITIIDTPGLAGLNESAKDISYNFLPNVDLALYVVFPQGFHQEDIKFLDFSEKYISNIIPIINQVDLIEKIKTNNDYSNLEDYNKKWKEISKISEKHPMFFYSSISNFDYNNRGNEALKKYIFETIVNDRDKLKKESIETKVQYLLQKIKSTLEQKKSLLTLSLDDPQAEIKIERLKNQMSKFDFDFKSEKTKIDERLNLVNNEFSKDFKLNLAKKALEEKNKIENKEKNKILKESFRDELKKTTKDFLLDSKEKWTAKIQEESNEIANEFTKEFNSEISKIFKNNFNFELETKIDKFEPININSLMESIESKKNTYIKMMQKLKESLDQNDINVQQIADERIAIEEYLKSYSLEADSILSKRNEIASSPIEYIDVINKGSGDKGKEIGKLVGLVADWSLIFLPGTQIKYLEPIMTVAKGMGASKEILSKIDSYGSKLKKINDLGVDFKKQIMGKSPIHNKSVSLFDKATDFMQNLTFQKWAGELGGKIGDFIDPPTITQEIDPEWEKMKMDSLYRVNEELEQLKKNMNLQTDNKYEIEKKRKFLEKQKLLNEEQIKDYHEMVNKLEIEKKNITLIQENKEENYILYLQSSIDKIFKEAKEQFIDFTYIAINNIEENLKLYVLEERINEKNNILKLLESTELNYNSSRDEKLKDMTLIDADLELLK